LYASDEVLKQIVKNRIMEKSEAMEECLAELVQNLHQFLTDIVDEIVTSRYRPLAVKVKESLFMKLSRSSEECTDQLKYMLKEEISYINVNHVDFVTG
jgi:Dynamin central region